MQESYLRQWHRRMGVILAFFIILQAGSGLLISLDYFLPTDPGGPVGEMVAALASFHRGGGWLAHGLRVLLGAGLVGMAISGSLIYRKIQARRR